VLSPEQLKAKRAAVVMHNAATGGGDSGRHRHLTVRSSTGRRAAVHGRRTTIHPAHINCKDLGVGIASGRIASAARAPRVQVTIREDREAMAAVKRGSNEANLTRAQWTRW